MMTTGIFLSKVHVYLINMFDITLVSGLAHKIVCFGVSLGMLYHWGKNIDSLCVKLSVSEILLGVMLVLGEYT